MEAQAMFEEAICLKATVVDKLYNVANTLDEQHRSIRGGKIASGCGGLVGSVLAITGIALSPVTFGASLGLTISGGVVGVSSAAGGIGAVLAEKRCTKNAVREAKRAKDEFNKHMETLCSRLANTEDHALLIRSIRGLVDAGAKGMGVAAAAVGASVTAAAGKAASVAGTGLKFLRVGGIVFSALTIPLDIGIIVSNSIDIHKKTPSETAENIRKVADDIESKPLFTEEESINVDEEIAMKESINVDEEMPLQLL